MSRENKTTEEIEKNVKKKVLTLILHSSSTQCVDLKQKREKKKKKRKKSF